MKKMTIKDIAKEVGVSFKTISRVINNEENVSEKTRIKVIEVLKKYNFSINYNAKSLNKSRTNQILLISNIKHKELPIQKNSLIVESVVKYARKLGYSIILNNDYDELDKTAYGTYEKGYFDGAIILNPKQFDFIDEMLVEKKPFIISGINKKYSYVGTDQKESSYIATKHLLELGSTNIYLLLDDSNLQTSKKKLEGYKEALLENQIDYDKRKVIYNISKSEDVENFLNNLEEKEFPLSLIINSDYCSLGAIRYINKNKIKVPEKLKIISFGNTYICSEVYPKLTAIKQDFDLIGKKLVELLVENIEKDISITNFSIPAKLIIRDTTVVQN